MAFLVVQAVAVAGKTAGHLQAARETHQVKVHPKETPAVMLHLQTHNGPLEAVAVLALLEPTQAAVKMVALVVQVPPLALLVHLLLMLVAVGVLVIILVALGVLGVVVLEGLHQAVQLGLLTRVVGAVDCVTKQEKQVALVL
jgi:hypothetical protein